MRILKSDELGRVELVESPAGPVVRRVACGCRWPGSRWLAHRLMARERRALAQLGGVSHVPQLIDDAATAGAPDADGRAVAARDVLLRTWLPGEPLWAVTELPSDFFDLLRELIAELHERGVCHNDLHKENNVLVARDGRPSVLDFQLASVHRRRGRRYAARCREDLRHVEKHRRIYDAAGARSARRERDRSMLSSLWMRLGKPIYNTATRRLLRVSRSEPRRPREGPWPERTPPVGPAPR